MDAFKRKIEYLYKELAKENLDTLTYYFLNPQKSTSRENRKKHIKKWLKQNTTPRLFKNEYKTYPFYKEVTLYGNPIFKDGQEFLSIDYSEFCNRVRTYINLKAKSYSSDSITQFSYLYLYNLNSKHRYKLLKYDITYEDRIEYDEYKVSLFNSEINIFYSGRATIKQNRLIMQFENSNDYVTLIVNLTSLSKESNFLIGVVAGISDIDDKTPIAKKVILSKKEFKTQEESKVYGILNETETIFAYEERFNNLPYETSHNPIEKTKNKIENLNNYFENLIKKSSYGECHYQLAFNELIETREIFKKISNNQSFNLFNRYSILNAILDSHPYEMYNKIYCVMPIYNSYFIFDDSSNKTKEIIDKLENLAIKKDVYIEILFVVINCKKEICSTFLNNLERLKKFATINFVSYDKIKKEMTTIDFIYTDKKNFILYKPLRFYRELFLFENLSDIISNYAHTFDKIKNFSIPYSNELKLYKFCKKSDYFIKELIGKWHLYGEGSIELFYYQVEIFENNSVEVYDKFGTLVDKGKIIYKPIQSILILDDLLSRRVGVIVFDTNHHAIKEAFVAKLLYKQYGKDDDIFTLGVFSKKEISLRDLKYIFRGDKNYDVRKLVDSAVNDRLIKYLSKSLK